MCLKEVEGMDIKMKNVRKVVTALLVLGMLAGCGNSADKDKKESINQTEQVTDQEKQEEVKDTQEETKDTQQETKDTQEETKGKSELVEISDNLMDFQVEIDGEVYTLPFPYEELRSKGWESNGEGKVLQPEYITPRQISNGLKTMNVTFLNTSKEDKDYLLCDIAGIEINSVQAKHTTVKLAKGIEIGSTKDDVISAYGEPQEMGVYSVTYIIQEENEPIIKKSVKIYFDNDIVDMITMENR